MGDSPPPWPGPDEDRVIDELLADPDCPHWRACDDWIDGVAQNVCPELHPQDRDVIAQQVKLNVRSGLPSFRRTCHLTSWMLPILRHERVSFFRSRAAQRDHEVSLEGLQNTDRRADDGDAAERPIPPLVAPDDVEYAAHIRDLLARVYAAIAAYIAKRKQPQRAADILDRWLAGMSATEIAEELGVAYQTIMNTISLLRKHLRALFPDAFAETIAPSARPQPDTPDTPDTLDASGAPTDPETDDPPTPKTGGAL